MSRWRALWVVGLFVCSAGCGDTSVTDAGVTDARSQDVAGEDVRLSDGGQIDRDVGDTDGAYDAAPDSALDAREPQDASQDAGEDVNAGNSGPPPPCPDSLSATEWTRLADMRQRRGEHANAVVDGRIVMLGGIYDSRRGPPEVESFDPRANTWAESAMMPETRNHFTVGHAVHEGEIWICGGKPDGQGMGGVTRVDVLRVADSSWRRGPELPEGHWAGPCVVLNGQLHAISGGVTNAESTNHHFVLDLNDEGAGWTTAAPIPEARVHVAGVPFEGRIWVIGGEFHHRHDGDTTLVQIYDPGSDSWSVGPALPEARSHHEWATFAHAGSIWSVSGVDSSINPRGQATIYRYVNDAWTQEMDLPARLVSPGAKIVDGVLYVFGGGVDTWFDGDLVRTYARCVSP